MSTPYIDTLNSAQKAILARKTKGTNRPSYYSAALAEASAQSGEGSSTVQITEDLEALLILCPKDIKQRVLDFLSLAKEIGSNTDDLDAALFSEVVSVRKDNYVQISVDTGDKIRAYDAAKSDLSGFVEDSSRQNGSKGSVASAQIIPELGVFYAAIGSSYDEINRPDELGVHDRVADAGFLYGSQRLTGSRAAELGSWEAIFQTYLI